MTTTPPTETRARECDCPPWVEKCAHWEDRRAVMACGDDLPACCGPWIKYQVSIVEGEPLPSSTCRDACPWRGWVGRTDYSVVYSGFDRDAAEAAFCEAESLLRGRDA